MSLDLEPIEARYKAASMGPWRDDGWGNIMARDNNWLAEYQC